MFHENGKKQLKKVFPSKLQNFEVLKTNQHVWSGQLMLMPKFVMSRAWFIGKTSPSSQLDPLSKDNLYGLFTRLRLRLFRLMMKSTLHEARMWWVFTLDLVFAGNGCTCEVRMPFSTRPNSWWSQLSFMRTFTLINCCDACLYDWRVPLSRPITCQSLNGFLSGTIR